LAVIAGTRVFRAVLESHARANANRLRREMGRRGVLLMSIITIVFGSMVALPFITWGAIAGYTGGLYIKFGLARGVLGTGLFVLSIGGGFLSGTTGGGRQLSWESYRAFPLRHGMLFAAELTASLFDPIPLVLSSIILAVVGGIAAAQPAATPLLLLVAVESIALLLLTQTIFASFAAALLRRLRVAFGLLLLVLFLGVPLLLSQGALNDPATKLSPEKLLALQAAFERVASWVPSRWGMESVQLVSEGRVLSALACHAFPVGFVLLGTVFASRLTARELVSGGIAPVGGSSRLWSFGSPAAGIARLMWQSLIDSAIGRFGLVVPFITLVLVRWPLSNYIGRGSFGVPAAYAYVALATSSIQFNQFGLDGHGIKALLLLPIEARDIFQGKSLGIAFYCTIQTTALALLLGTVQHVPVHELAAGALYATSLTVLYNMVGRWTSSWLPRSMSRRQMRSVNAPGPFVLATLLMTLLTGTVLGGVYMACARWAPWALVPAMAILLALSVLVHRLTLPSALRYFEMRREKVLEALT